MLAVRFPRGGRFTLVVLALLIAGLAVSYANGLTIAFTLDDVYLIELNPWIRSLAYIPRFFYDPFAMTTIRDNADFRPLLVISYALNYAMSGLMPWSYHALSLLIHLVNSVLVFVIVRDFVWWPPAARGPAGAARIPAAAAALFFALAPLNSQPVVYTSARSASLATMFYLAAFLAFLRRRRPAMGVLHALALLTKAVAVTLPAAILLYDFLYRDRTRYRTVAAYLSDWRRLAPPVLITGAVDVCYLAYRSLGLPADVARGGPTAPFVTPWVWFMSQWWAQLEYARLFLWPDALSVDHESIYVFSLFEARAWVPLTVILLWLGVALWQSARRPIVAFATAWFFVTLSVESSFFPISELTNDHRPYIATSLGLSVLLAWGLYTLAARLGPRAVPLFAASTLVLALAAVPVIRDRVSAWKDPVRLWKDAARVGPSNARAWVAAGVELGARGQYAEARRYLEKAREMSPAYVHVYMNLSALEGFEGNAQAALRDAEMAVRVAPRFSTAHYCHGVALERLGRREEAAAAYQRAVELNPSEIRAATALAQLRKR